MLPNRTARRTNRGTRTIDVGRPRQSKSEVRDPARFAGLSRLALEHEDVTAARRLRLDEVVRLVNRHDTQDRLIEAKRLSADRVTASAT